MTNSSSPVRERRDIKALEKRRQKAGRLFASGLSQAEVARRLKVSRPSVHAWHTAWQEQGIKGLASNRGVFGRMPRLTARHIHKVKTAILAGPRKSGFATDLWTLKRIAKVIRQKTSVSYHPGHVWRILQTLGFSCQKPAQRPRERNEKAIKAWREREWPAIQKRGFRPAPV